MSDRPMTDEREALRQGAAHLGRRDVSVVTVLGMHRSGTSAVAAALCEAGFWAGERDELMPGDVFNERGYFERRETAELLDRELDALGGSWKRPPVTRLTRLGLEPVRPVLQSLYANLRGHTPRGRVPLIKDPRLSLFASELPSVLGGTEGIVLCVRHPLAVARSLRARDGIPLAVGLALWEAYNTSVCRGLSGRPVRVRAFGSEVFDQQPLEAFVGGLAEAAGLERVAQVTAPAAELVHQHSDDQDELQWLSAAQVSLWHALAEAARSQQPTVLWATELSAIAQRELERSSDDPSVIAPDSRVDHQVSALTAAVDDAGREREVQQAEVARLAAELRDAETQLVEALERSSRHAVRAAAAERENLVLKDAADEQTARVQELAEAENQLPVVAAHLDEARLQIADLLAARETAARLLAAALGDVDELLEWVEELEARVAAVEQRAAATENGFVLRQQQALREIDFYRGMYEEVVTAFGRWHTTAARPSHEDVQAWLSDLHRVEHGPAASCSAAAASPLAAEDLHRALTELDRVKGFVHEVRATFRLQDGRDRDPSDEAVLAWVASLGNRHAALPPMTIGQDSVRGVTDRLVATEEELERLRSHRDAILADYLSVMGSESWKLGHALTWPVRILRRNRSTGTPSEP